MQRPKEPFQFALDRLIETSAPVEATCRAETRSAPTVSAGRKHQPVVPVVDSAGRGVARQVDSRPPPSALRKPPIFDCGEPPRTSVGDARRDSDGPRRLRRAQVPGGSESGSDGGRRVGRFDWRVLERRLAVRFFVSRSGSGPGSDVERRRLFSSHWSRSAWR